MITIDIEDTRIRMLRVAEKRVEKAAAITLEPGMVENGVVVNKEAVSRKIKELLAAQNITDKQVIASISGIHSIYNVVSLPHLNRDVVAEAARREMERATPVPLGELYTSWQAIDTSDTETLICFVGLPRNTVDAMTETLRLAGLQSRGMDLAPLALARLSSEKDALIINARPLSFDIVVMINGIPESLRSLPFPVGDLSEPDKLNVIREEVDRTIAFYNSSHKDRPITHQTVAFVNGEQSELLSNSLGYASKPLPAWFSVPENFEMGQYAVNVGLALRQVKDFKPALRINLDATPSAYLPKKRPLAEVVSWVIPVVGVAILIPLVILTQQEVAKTFVLRDQYNTAEAQVNTSKAATEMMKQEQSKIDTMKAASTFLQDTMASFKAQRSKINSDLSKVTSLLPGKMNLTSIIQGTAISLQGTAPDKTTILDYTRALRDTGRFINVIISDMHEVEHNVWEFTIQVQ